MKAKLNDAALAQGERTQLMEEIQVLMRAMRSGRRG